MLGASSRASWFGRQGGEAAARLPCKNSCFGATRATPGFTQTPLSKMGWLCSDTATLHFDDVRVPVDNLVGTENQGFKAIMQNFNRERIFLAAGANGFAQVCLDEALAWARQREMFGGKLIDQQVTRHKLADMAMRIEATQAMLETLAWRVEQGESPVGEICLLKNQATQTMAFCASEAVPGWDVPANPARTCNGVVFVVAAMDEFDAVTICSRSDCMPAANVRTISGTAAAAQGVFDALSAAGIDLVDVFKLLEDEGVDKFEKSWGELLEAVQGQLDAAK